MINSINLSDMVCRTKSRFSRRLIPCRSLRLIIQLSAEYGRNSGPSSTSPSQQLNDYHGELFESLRNDALDARNFQFLPADLTCKNRAGLVQA